MKRPVWARVVGVVRHMRHHDPRFQAREEFFVPFAQGARNQMGLAVRARGNPMDLSAPAKAAVAAIDKDPTTLGLVPLVLASVAILASWIPARRAARADPTVVLREE